MNLQIIELLGTNKHQYELHLLDRYFIWCELQAFDDDELQLLLTSKSVSKWWAKEYSALENEFLQIVKPYQTVSATKKLRVIYTETTIQIGNLYPKTLFNEIRKRRKTPSFKAAHTGARMCLN